jgi:putative flippase GtrA
VKQLIAAHREKINYLVAGTWNAAFGYSSFVILYFLFSARVHYMFLWVISNVLSITNAYISYKFFVFRTKGNYLREYLRFYVVYGSSMLLGFVLMPISVEVFHVHPAIAQAGIMAITVVISYLGHKHFSFKRNR